MSYRPPFEVSAEAINMIAEISALVERFAIRLEQADGLLLRKINRIKTIRGSLAIEGNTLSESMIRDIIDGKNVVAPIREIQEAKNAIKVYDRYGDFDPFSIEDMLKAHGLMMEALADDAGHFRKTGVGVFEGGKAIHIAPPAGKVPYLMEELFQWLENSKDHLLIKSCVFHYEFEFIHPFSDGNGRIGRLWQSLILGKLNPVFEHLPVENMVFSNQQKYYHAIQKSTEKTDSGIFVDFMLGEILRTIKERKGEPLKKQPESQPESPPESLEQKVLSILKAGELSKAEISNKLGQKEISGRLNQVIREMLKKQIIEYTIPEKPNSRLQKYRLKEKDRKKGTR
jgi:Fic family protein